MNKSMVVLLAGIVLGYGGAVMARGGGQQDGQYGNHGGMASGHMSQEGRDNTNAQWSGGATKGQGRSDLRSGDNDGHGQNHGKSPGQGHGHGKHMGKGGSHGGAH